MIMRSVSYSNFYRSVQNKLQQVFLGCKVVSKGINNHHNTSDSGSAGPAAILQYVDVAGSSLLLPPANFNLGNTATASAPSSSSSSLTVSMRDLDTVTETVGRRLTLMFGEKYGYRKGSEEEARDGKLKQTMNRVVSAVAEGPLSATVSKGWKKQVTQAAEAAKGNAGKSEFLEKQLHLEKAAREKSNSRIFTSSNKKWRKWSERWRNSRRATLLLPLFLLRVNHRFVFALLFFSLFTTDFFVLLFSFPC